MDNISGNSICFFKTGHEEKTAELKTKLNNWEQGRDLLSLCLKPRVIL